MIVLALLAVSAVASPTAALSPTPTPARPAQAAIVWHLAPAPYVDKSMRAASLALLAPDDLGAPLRALRAHPRARFSFALDADALDGLARAAANDTALTAMASGHVAQGDPRADDLLRILAQVPVLDSHLSATAAARRYQALAAAAPLALAGQRSARFSLADNVDFAGFGAIVRLATVGALPSNSPLLAKNALSSAEASAAVLELAKVDGKVLDGIRAAAAAGQLELLADPAQEPILPLLIDGGGKSGPNVVLVNASADAAYLIDGAARAVGGLAPGANPGVYSPHGAYDDKTAALLEQHHAAFALFSDRVLRASPIGGSREAVAIADAAAFHGYSLRPAAGPAMPALFWNQDASIALSVFSSRFTAGAMGARILALAHEAGARGGDGSVLVIRIDADGLWNRRADRAQVVDGVAAALASGSVESVTLAGYVHQHPPTATSYGFAPAADEGALTYWMGSQNQASMWNALAAARKAAGGDDVLQHDAALTPLLDAEASRWYLVPSLLAPAADIQRLMDQYRSLIAGIYRGVGQTVPPNLAPMRPEAPPPLPVVPHT